MTDKEIRRAVSALLNPGGPGIDASWIPFEALVDLVKKAQAECRAHGVAREHAEMLELLRDMAPLIREFAPDTGDTLDALLARVEARVNRG